MSAKKWKTTVEHTLSCVIYKNHIFTILDVSTENMRRLQCRGTSDGGIIGRPISTDEEKAGFFHSFTTQYL